MKAVRAVLLLGACVATLGSEVRTNPLGKVVDLLDELTAKVTKDGEVEAKAFTEYMEWCDDVAKNGKFAVETAAAQKEKLEAKIGELTSSVSVSVSKIEDLAASIAQGESELKNATLIREKEVGDFETSESELMDVVDTVGRAIGLLEKEMSKNPAALAQVDTTHMASILQALSTVLDAAAFSSSDQKKLASFVQSQQAAEDDDAAFGAPAAAVYKTKSGGIVDVLEDMKEKAESQLAELRKAEVNTNHNYEMLKQSLEDQSAADTKDMGDEKAAKAAAEESKAVAEGDLEVTVKDLASSKEDLATAQSTCMEVAADHEATVASRAAELKAIAEAKKVLGETSSGAVSQTYSFVQVASATGSRLQTRADLAKSEVVTMVKQLARKHHSAALAQLASRLAAVMRYGAADGEDIFSKVKGLIADMISKLEKEAGSEATEKAYCDEQMSKTEAKKSELEEDVAKLTAKIDQAVAKSAQLKAEIKELQGELSALAKEQAEMDKIRQETHADYEAAKADLELGLSGVRQALSILRDYYGAGAAAMLQDGTKFAALMQQPAKPELHSKAQGAGDSIVGILEVVESDFATNLAKEETQEEDAQAEYEKMTQENKVTKTMKDQDVKYKTQDAKSTDKSIADMSSDRETENAELTAVLEYYAKIKDRCIAKPETYEERKRRRDAEIQGLKEALSVIEDETAFVQRKRRGGNFRGALVAH
jgi:hypothetical protein